MDSPEEIRTEILAYYKQLLSAEPNPHYPGKNFLAQFVTKRLDEAQIVELSKKVSYEEVSSTFLSLHPNKAPGPASFNGCFFKKLDTLLEMI